MASLDDILTTQKNGVVAINGLQGLLQTISDNSTFVANSTYPSTVSATVVGASTTLIASGSGKIFSVSIPYHSGSAQVYIYDSATTAGLAAPDVATNLIYASLPSNAATFTPYQTVQLPYKNGLVLKAEANTTFCVGYTPNP